jgi:hypothetical protein
MPARQTDPARLKGQELTTWYTTPTADREAQKQAAYNNAYEQYFGAPPQMSASEKADFRKQQAAYDQARRKSSDENWWLSIPALAPAGAVLLAEGVGTLAARYAPIPLNSGPHVLTERMPHLRVGDNWATRAGRRAHDTYRDMAKAKGWEVEQTLEGSRLRPDIKPPQRVTGQAQPPKIKYIEIKPNTPSGRAAAARQVKQYQAQGGVKVRTLYYQPKNFL